MKLIKSINKSEHKLFSKHHSKYGYKKSIDTICSVLDDHDKFNVVYERYGKAKFYLSKYWDTEDGRKINIKFVESMNHIKIYVDDCVIESPRELTEKVLLFDLSEQYEDAEFYETDYGILDSLIHQLL